MLFGAGLDGYHEVTAADANILTCTAQSRAFLLETISRFCDIYFHFSCISLCEHLPGSQMQCFLKKHWNFPLGKSSLPNLEKINVHDILRVCATLPWTHIWRQNYPSEYPAAVLVVLKLKGDSSIKQSN